jgi:hypothetical protein
MTQSPPTPTGGEETQPAGRKRYPPPPPPDAFGPPPASAPPASGPPSSGPPNQPGFYQPGYPQPPTAGYPQPPQPGYQQPAPAGYQPQYQQAPPAGYPQQPPYPAVQYQPVAPSAGVTKPSAYWPLSVIACLFFLPAAAVALYFSAQVGNRWSSGDYQGARKASSTALIAGIIAIAVSLCVLGTIVSSSSGS